MKRFEILFAVVFIFICLSGCSIRYLKYRKAIKELQNSEISEEDFLEKFYSFYQKDKVFPDDSTSALKFEGRYVLEEFYASSITTTYRTLKFFQDGTVYETLRMNEYPNKYNLQKVESASYCFALRKNKVEIEALMVRAWELENIIKTGEIRNDTIAFYETRYLDTHLNKSKMDIKYIYDADLE